MARRIVKEQGPKRRSFQLAAILAIALCACGGVVMHTTSGHGAGTGVPEAFQAVQALQLRAEAHCPVDHAYVSADDVGVDVTSRCIRVGGSWNESHVDPVYSRIAGEVLAYAAPLDKRLGSREPLVVCWDLADFQAILKEFRSRRVEFAADLMGWVPQPERVINLSTWACRTLDKIVKEDDRSFDELSAIVIGALTHEAMHLGGIPEEGIADCYAIQLAAFTAERLGGNRAFSAFVERSNYTYARERRAGTAYDDPECYQRGALDLDLPGGVWG